MNPEKTGVNPALCPLCGADNQCGNLLASKGQACWCRAADMTFPEALLQRIPQDARGKACICRGCVAQQNIEPNQ